MLIMKLPLVLLLMFGVNPTTADPMLIAAMEDEICAEMGVIQPELDRIKRELLHDDVAASGSLIPCNSCSQSHQGCSL